jgi:serine/threonine-protein kinase HipA
VPICACAGIIMIPCTDGYNGEHATSVNGSSRPTEADMVAAGAKGKLRPERCRKLITEVRYVCCEMLGEG